MNAPTVEATLQPAWVEVVLAVPMEEGNATATPTAEETSDQWVSQMLTECYN